MFFIYLVLYMISLLPIRSDGDLLFRIELAQAIADATTDETEQLTLVRIARYESGFRHNVAACVKLGDHGKSYGTFQIQPMSRTDAKLVCGTPASQVSVALRYIRRSAEVCPENKGAAKLNVYVSGRCDWGLNESRKRWGGIENQD